MQGDARNRQNQAAIGNGIIGAIQSVQSNRRRAIDEKRAMDAQDLAFAKDGVDQDSIEAYKNGDKSGISKFYAGLNEAKRDQAARDKLLDQRVKESTIASNEATAADKAKPFLESRDGQAFKAKSDYESQRDAQKEAAKNAAKTTGEAFEVPGYGNVRTKAEAERIRTAKGDAETAKQYIDEIKKLGTNVAVWDRGRIGKINQLKQALVGKLRLPLMGPGTMTEDEFQRTVSNLGDPSTMFGSEENEIGKLDQMSGILDKNISAMYGAAASNNQPSAYQAQQQPAQAPQQVIQKIQQYTPEQKLQRLEQLRAKKAGVAMAGQ